MTHTLPKRKDVKIEDTWKLEDIFETDDAFKASFAACEALIPTFKDFTGKLTQDAHTLYDFLVKQDVLWQDINKLYVYSHMRLHQDGGNDFYQDLSSQAEMLSIKASEVLSFASSELSNLTADQITAFCTEVPELKLYVRYLSEILRQKVHILDAQTEALLARIGELAGTPSNAFAMLNNVDLKFPTIKNEKGEDVRITHGNYISFLESNDRSVREAAFSGLYSTYDTVKNTIAALFTGNVKQYGFFSTTRHYESPLHAALSENNIPVSVYDNLIDTVNKNLNIMHDYVALRKEALGVDILHMYDLFVPIVKDFQKLITFNEACDIVLKALAPMGEDYVALLKEAFDNRWIDKYENEGKRSGAYSWGTYGAPHPYVLMNYTNNVHNLFTLAHEMGHAMHSYFSSHTQPHIYADYCIFVAEVASTVNEALLMQYLLKTTTDPLFKKYLINYFMEQFRSTLYRQTMFAEFEKEVHLLNSKGITLTTKLLCDKYYALVKKYHGDAMEIDEAIALEWARIPHFYTPFYVYQYATGYSAAITLSERILKEGESAVKDYMQFLSGGSSKDPIDLLKLAGVDMSKPEPIETALKQFAALIDEFKQMS